MYEDCCLLVVCPKLVPFFFLPGDVFSMETEVAGFAAKKKRRETNANPHGVAHLQPEAEKPVAWMEQKAMRVFKQPKHSP